jgi:hypothetical protein
MKVEDDDTVGADMVIDPVAMARRDLAKALPRRFWTSVSLGAADSGFQDRRGD